MGGGASTLTSDKAEAMVAEGLTFIQENRTTADHEELASSLKKFARMRKVGVTLQHCLMAMEFRDKPLPKELIEQFQSWVSSKPNGVVTANDIQAAFGSSDVAKNGSTKKTTHDDDEKHRSGELWDGEEWGGNNKNGYVNMIAHLDGFETEMYSMIAQKKMPVEEVESVVASWCEGKTVLQKKAAKRVLRQTIEQYQTMVNKQRRREEKAAMRAAEGQGGSGQSKK